MKKYLIIALFFIGTFSTGFGQTVKIKYSSAVLVYNNSVGNEWSSSAKINGNVAQKNKTYKINANNGLKLHCSAVEHEKYPDRGSNSMKIDLSEIPKGGSKIYSIDVIVKEDRGRYAGNTAKWRFAFEISR